MTALIMGAGYIAGAYFFDHDHVAFWLWTALYFTTPFLVPLAWLRNRRTVPGSPCRASPH